MNYLINNSPRLLWYDDLSTDVYYGGEALSVEQPQSLTCPFCGKMGYTETSLQDHVTADHPDTANEVVCPFLTSTLL